MARNNQELTTHDARVVKVRAMISNESHRCSCWGDVSEGSGSKPSILLRVFSPE